jgi:ATP-dependent helicase/nuclease subunit B
VIDYKTGGYWAKKWASGVFAGGTRLQHAIYGLAAVQLLKRHYRNATVSGGVYYFSSVKGGKERRVIPSPSPASIREVLSDLRDMIAAGVFGHTRDKDDCTYCDYVRGCGAPKAVQNIASKLEDKRLAVRVRLSNHE